MIALRATAIMHERIAGNLCPLARACPPVQPQPQAIISRMLLQCISSLSYFYMRPLHSTTTISIDVKMLTHDFCEAFFDSHHPHGFMAPPAYVQDWDCPV